MVSEAAGRKAARPRKRKPSGRVLRVSSALHDKLTERLRAGESWDSLLRRLLGFPPSEKGRPGRKTQTSEALFSGYLLRSTGQTYVSAAKARGAAVQAAAEAGEEQPERPITVREVL